ncbi:HWE histidine kinase domain-containing protein [Qipengyuania marisflavi]|uniref:histidine kinase n=1 Tax=Qipengyuania marisflavi TaxID=2486356 RepID=A0A5S3P7W3_9SPHN|nr:HWE histidine kinase domain-containing protein [Qipengyuania marisflavi]TMM48333.1 PAS domain S-box protein [Qipengyuania marisflavi]
MTDNSTPPDARADELAAQLISAKRSGGATSSERVRFLEAMTEAVPVGIVFADTTGRIVHGNSRAEEMVRHPVYFSDDVDSYGEWISFHPDGRQVQSHEYPLSRVIRDGESSASLDVHYQRGDGTRFWMRIIGRPVCDADGAMIGATVALIDIDHERQLQKSQDILIAELNHRVKNAFSVTMAIVRRSLKDSIVPQETMEAIASRLGAYSSVHSRLIGSDWGYATLRQIADDVLRPIGGDNISLDGPPVRMSSQMGISLSMALYELATNATKYGSLSVDGGTVAMHWEIDASQDPESVCIRWREEGGPPATKPHRKGFGTFITQRAVAAETKGDVSVSYNETGLEWALTMPRPQHRENII